VKKLICGIIALLITFQLYATGSQQPSIAAKPKLTYYEPLARAAMGNKSFATHMGWVEMQKRLNIDVEFISPPLGNENETFNLMLASRDFPDIIQGYWFTAPGGPANYIGDAIIKLNDPINKWAPDVKKTFERYPVAKREATLDDGTLYVFPQIYADPTLRYSYGPMFRRDLAAKIPALSSLKFPDDMETLDDWERILTAVKNSGLTGDSGRPIIPLAFWNSTLSNVFIVGSFGITGRFSQENNNPVYGPVDPRYRDFLVLMKRWFDMGLIDPEFAATDGNSLDAKVLDNRVFAFPHNMGNGFTRYTQMAREHNPEFLLNTTKFPVQKKGEQPAFSGRTYDYVSCGAAISTACKNVEAATRLLNYDFSDEGYILANFGIEGKTFNWDTSIRPSTTLVSGATHPGYPKYTDFIMNNPDFSRDVAMSVYLRVGLMSYAFKGLEFLEQRDNLPEQNGPNGRALWMASSDKNLVPSVSPTQQESADFGQLMTAINTYVDEMTVKFIMGAEPLNDASWNNYIQTIQRMGIGRALDIMRAQIDRYNKRP